PNDVIRNHRQIPEKVKKVILNMSSKPGVKAKDIQWLVDVHPVTISHICHVYRETDKVVRTPTVIGRPQILNGLDVAFLEGCVKQQPDIFLNGLKKLMQEVCGVNVSPCTIHQTLRQRGYT
ncbi:hypothetical protein B0H21DRAFT_695328, partial [Amylocystis lapponica]